MRRAEWTTDDGDETTIGVVGQPGDLERLERKTGDFADVFVSDTVEETLERSLTFVVCVGERSVSAIARTGESVPVLPIDATPHVQSLSMDRLPDAIDTILAGEVTERVAPILHVESDSLSKPARAVFDVSLVTEEPARISEYSVTSRGEPLAQFRADGVVAATPQGSHGYASAAGGPLVSASLDALAVVPIAPFVTQTRQWILPDDDLCLSVERDEGPVVIQVDDRTLGRIDPATPVAISAAETLTLLVPDGLQRE